MRGEAQLDQLHFTDDLINEFRRSSIGRNLLTYINARDVSKFVFHPNTFSNYGFWNISKFSSSRTYFVSLIDDIEALLKAKASIKLHQYLQRVLERIVYLYANATGYS